MPAVMLGPLDEDGRGALEPERSSSASRFFNSLDMAEIDWGRGG